MRKTLLINILACSFICALISLCELFFYNHTVNTVLLFIYFLIPLGMVILTVIEMAFSKKNETYIHIVNIVKFDVFFVLAVLSLVVEGAKAFNITLKIGLTEIIAGLATLVALDRVLIYAKIAFEKKLGDYVHQNETDNIGKKL